MPLVRLGPVSLQGCWQEHALVRRRIMGNSSAPCQPAIRPLKNLPRPQKLIAGNLKKICLKSCLFLLNIEDCSGISGPIRLDSNLAAAMPPLVTNQNQLHRLHLWLPAKMDFLEKVVAGEELSLLVFLPPKEKGSNFT